jgi:hypothetical protein
MAKSSKRHVYSRTASNSLVLDDIQMAALGYDTNNVSDLPRVWVIPSTTLFQLGLSTMVLADKWNSARRTHHLLTDYPTNRRICLYNRRWRDRPGIDDGSGGTAARPYRSGH